LCPHSGNHTNARFVAYLAPDDNKIKNVFVMCISCEHTRQVTFERNDDVLGYSWTGVEDVIVYKQDNNGDENTMLFKKNISEAEIGANPEKRTVISNCPGVKALILGNNLRDARILVGLNDENPAYHNVYSFDLKTDTMTLMVRNRRFGGFISDNALDTRLATEEQPDGSLMYFRWETDPSALTSDSNDWEEYLLVQPEDTAITPAFDKSNQNVFWIWGEGSDLGALVTFPSDAVDRRKVLYTPTRAQIDNIVFHPTDRTVLAVTEEYHKPELFVVNDTIAEDIEYLKNLRPEGSLQILSMSLDPMRSSSTEDRRPGNHKPNHKSNFQAEFLFNTRPELEKYKLNRQVGFDFKTRDDMVLQAYLSLPPEAALRPPEDVKAADRGFAKLGLLPVEPQKLVVLVHGGPNARDYYGYSGENAWLTNRGYAVLQVNFRGSVGFGKRLKNAGDGEWSRKMHYDILDSVEFAVAKGITTKTKVAIMGGSYGGYETLVALTFTPDEFECGVDIVGPSNLITLLQTTPAYWQRFYKELVRMMGDDIDTEAGRQSLTARSPLFYADRVTKPLLIIQGANDPRVKQQESDQFVAALQKNNIPVSYILYPDEGHGCRKAKNRLAQYGFIEKFLHTCLGGRMEPFHQGQYNSSAIHIFQPTSRPTNPTLPPQIFYRPIAPQPVLFSATLENVMRELEWDDM
uniref:Peptidase_S9 domain-containing protein n=1 Tax=Heligmosomoides polygyrus TaxID=6339 RepID=A0A8L8JTC0_HELPZ